VRSAVESDLQVAISILHEAVNWLIGIGMPLWKASDVTIEVMKPAVDSGQLIVAEQSGEVVAVVLRQWEDRLFWPDRKEGQAIYLHKLAVRRANAGQGFSKALVDWIADDAAGRGRKYLRLDCAPRPALLRVYENLGFVRIDERQVGTFTVARLEKEIFSLKVNIP